MTKNELRTIHMLCSVVVDVGEVYSSHPHLIAGLNEYDFVETSLGREH
jgi:hypothetical protein